MTPTATRFEDRLLAELRHVVAAQPAPTGATAAPRRPRRTRLALSGVGIATATAAVAIIATSGDVTASAYAVQPRSDGAVTVSIHRLDDASGLQRSLRAAGIPAVVHYAAGPGTACVTGSAPVGGATDAPSLRTGGQPGSATAPTGPGLQAVPDAPGTVTGTGPTTVTATATAIAGSVRVDPAGATFTIDPGKLEPGQKVFITTTSGAVSSVATAIGTVDPATVCGSTESGS